MIAGACVTAVVSGLLVGAIAFAWRLGRGTAQDPKLLLLNTLMRHATRWHGHGHLR
jgi:hypothetical protein